MLPVQPVCVWCGLFVVRLCSWRKGGALPIGLLIVIQLTPTEQVFSGSQLSKHASSCCSLMHTQVRSHQNTEKETQQPKSKHRRQRKFNIMNVKRQICLFSSLFGMADGVSWLPKCLRTFTLPTHPGNIQDRLSISRLLRMTRLTLQNDDIGFGGLAWQTDLETGCGFKVHWYLLVLTLRSTAAQTQCYAWELQGPRPMPAFWKVSSTKYERWTQEFYGWKSLGDSLESHNAHRRYEVSEKFWIKTLVQQDLTQNSSDLLVASACDPKAAMGEIWSIYRITSHNHSSFTALTWSH